MKIDELIITSRDYLEQFTHDQYRENFTRFMQKAAPFFDANTAENTDEVFSCIMAMHEGLSRRELKDILEKDKQVLAFFLTPAALKHNEQAREFAEKLKEKWNKQYPRYRYNTGTYETILHGFDSNLLGLPLRKK